MHLDRDHRRIWRLALALFSLVLIATVLFSEMLVSSGVDRIMHIAAERRMADWLRHLRQDHPEVMDALKGGRLTPALQNKLRREATHHGLTSFRLVGKEGHVVAQLKDGETEDLDGSEPVLRLPMHLKQAFVSAAVTEANDWIRNGRKTHEHVVLNFPVRNLSGETVGHLEAHVDVQPLHQSIERWVQSIVIISGVAVLLVAGIAWWVFRIIRRDSQRHLVRLTKHDELTGLPNRRHCLEDIARWLDSNERSGTRFVFLLLDMENFDRIASIHGHLAAERLLQATATRLQESVTKQVRIYRFDSDNFAILAPFTSREEIMAFGERLLAVVRRPLPTPGGVLHPSASLGAVIVPDDADTVEQIVRRATLVCWAAMREGGNRMVFYHPQIEEVQRRDGHLERLVKSALRDRRLEMHFQPLVRLADFRLYGFEALLRMRDEAGELISPEEFIPIAEEYGMMEEFGAFALRESCRVAAAWPRHLSIAVNLSPLQFETGTLVALVKDALNLTGLAPERLELEVTESLMLEDSARVLEQLHELKRMGVRIVLDDFGTGYSSLSYLWRFPFDKIKIDRSFVSALKTHPDVRTVLRATLAMAKGMRLPVTAEGIEYEDQAQWLRAHGCDLGQGWLFGRPQPEDAVPHIILADRAQAEAVPMRASAVGTAASEASPSVPHVPRAASL